MTVCLLRGPLSVRGRKHQFFRFLIDVGENPENPKTDAGKWKIRPVSTKCGTHNRCKRVKRTGTPVWRVLDVPCQRFAHPRLQHTSEVTTSWTTLHKRFILHLLLSWSAILANLAIGCSNDQKPSLQKLTTKPVSFSLKHFTMHFSFLQPKLLEG